MKTMLAVNLLKAAVVNKATDPNVALHNLAVEKDKLNREVSNLQAMLEEVVGANGRQQIIREITRINERLDSIEVESALLMGQLMPPVLPV